MSIVLAGSEFFVYEQEVWMRDALGSVSLIKETDYNFINEMIRMVSTFYPKAYAALCEEYSQCAENTSYYRFRMVLRFIRCNFSALDSIPDIGQDHRCSFEHLNCPLRGECRHDHVICRPEFNHQLSQAEKRVMSLVYDGLTEAAIGQRLQLSTFTVHTHVRNAYARLGIHSKAEFMIYATIHNIFS